MSFTWPEFTQPQPLDGSRTWTAKFDSYDQYREVCYYEIMIHGDIGAQKFMVAVGTEFAGDDWTSPAFLDELRARLERVAVTGQTNTDYQGAVLRR